MPRRRRPPAQRALTAPGMRVQVLGRSRGARKARPRPSYPPVPGRDLCCMPQVTYEEALRGGLLHGVATYRLPHHPAYAPMFAGRLHKAIWARVHGSTCYTRIVSRAQASICAILLTQPDLCHVQALASPSPQLLHPSPLPPAISAHLSPPHGPAPLRSATEAQGPRTSPSPPSSSSSPTPRSWRPPWPRSGCRATWP